jgi:phage shock protein C
VNSLRTKFYKDKANGKFMGVCAGIADYTGIDILWARIGMLTLMWLSGGVVFMAYLALGILAENKPSGMYADRQEENSGRACASRPAAPPARSAPTSATSTAAWPPWRPITSPPTRACRTKSKSCAKQRQNIKRGISSCRTWLF